MKLLGFTCRLTVIILLISFSSVANAYNYLLYSKQVDPDIKHMELNEKKNKKFSFISVPSNNVFGGISVNQTNGGETTKINLANYYIPLKGDYVCAPKKDNDGNVLKDANGKNICSTDQDGNITILKYPSLLIPFQIYVSPQMAGSGTPPDNSKAINQTTVLDQTGGAFVINLPFFWKYEGAFNPSTEKMEGFLVYDEPDYGSRLGGEITISAKSLKNSDGTTENPTFYGAGLGGSVKLPIGDKSTILKDSFFAFSGMVHYSRMSGTLDASKLFTPVLDANGNLVPFKKSISTYELIVALSVTKQFAISAKRIGPLENNDYINPQTVISFDSTF